MTGTAIAEAPETDTPNLASAKRIAGGEVWTEAEANLMGEPQAPTARSFIGQGGQANETEKAVRARGFPRPS